MRLTVRFLTSVQIRRRSARHSSTAALLRLGAELELPQQRRRLLLRRLVVQGAAVRRGRRARLLRALMLQLLLGGQIAKAPAAAAAAQAAVVEVDALQSRPLPAFDAPLRRNDAEAGVLAGGQHPPRLPPLVVGGVGDVEDVAELEGQPLVRQAAVFRGLEVEQGAHVERSLLSRLQRPAADHRFGGSGRPADVADWRASRGRIRANHHLLLQILHA